MDRRTWLLIAASAAGAYAWASAIELAPRLLGVYPERQITWGGALSITCLAAWTALEITERLVERRPIRCRCGYSLAGVKCPECGGAVGGAGSTGVGG